MRISLLKENNWTDTAEHEFTSVAELGKLVTRSNYAPGLYRYNYTSSENFLSTELIVLDFDNAPDQTEVSLVAARELFKSYKCLIATTRNHQKMKHDLPAVDRYRVILFLSRPINDEETYAATWAHVSRMFPGLDSHCKDTARRFFKSSDVIFVNETGKLIDPVAPTRSTMSQRQTESRPLREGERGLIASRARKFMVDGAPPGHWNNELYFAARDYQQNGYTEDEFIVEAEKITGHLDERDLLTISSAFSRPPKHPPRVMDKDTPAVEKWVRNWLTEHKAAMTYGEGAISVDGRERTTDVVLARITLDAEKYAEDHPIETDKGKKIKRPPYSQERIERVFTVWQQEQADNVIRRYQEKLEFDGSDSTPLLRRWLEAVTGSANDLDLAVMTHFIWQVKRKLFALPVEWHMMPLLKGKTGSGKTVALRQFLAPLGEVSKELNDMSCLGDSRENFIFTRYFVAFFDEMAKAEKVDVSALKNKITSATISYRKLGTNHLITGPNRCTFIGATNLHIQDIIIDPTSARRFWQIHTLDKIVWDDINSLPYESLWRGVDEYAECPVKPLLAEILKKQDEEFRAKSLPEIWLAEAMETTNENWLSAKEAHDSFKDWCDDQGIKQSLTRNKFGRILSSLGVQKKSGKDGNYYGLKEFKGNKLLQLKLVDGSDPTSSNK